MTFKEFKKHFHDRAINEYGFIKEKNAIIYKNDEVLIVFDIVKSGYSNSLSRFGIGVNPLDMIEKWGMYEPLSSDNSRLGESIGGEYVELDDVEDFKYYDKLFDDFFKNKFPNWLTINSIKEMIKSNRIVVLDYIKEFWNIK